MASHSTDTPHDTNTTPLLRTGPESALKARTEAPRTPEGEPPDTTPLFPPPEPEPDFLSLLADWDRFAVLAIHLDAPAKEEDNQAVHDAIGAALAAMAQQSEMAWIRWDDALYGCAAKGMEAESAMALAQQIQNRLSEKHLDTVSVGVSEFPLDSYDRKNALLNACKALDHAAFFGPGSTVRFDAVSLNISGDHAYQAGRMQAAIAEYRAALRLDENDVNVHNSLGVCLAQTGDVDAARTSFETSLALEPEEAMAAYNLGVLSLLREDRQNAMHHFETAYTADDQIFDIPFQIGKLLAEKGACKKARRYLEAAVALSQTSAPAYNCLGGCLKALGHDKEAIAAYKKAVKINPMDASALSALATLYDAKGENPDICLTFGRQSVALAPENPEFRLRLAELLHKYDKLEESLEMYESAAALGQEVGQIITDIQTRIEAIEEKKRRCA